MMQDKRRCCFLPLMILLRASDSGRSGCHRIVGSARCGVDRLAQKEPCKELAFNMQPSTPAGVSPWYRRTPIKAAGHEFSCYTHSVQSPAEQGSKCWLCPTALAASLLLTPVFSSLLSSRCSTDTSLDFVARRVFINPQHSIFILVIEDNNCTCISGRLRI